MTAVERLAEIEARAAAATEGPWAVEHGRIWQGLPFPEAVEVATLRGSRTWLPDAAFIAHTRADVPWLVEQVHIRDAAIAAVRALADKMADEQGQSWNSISARRITAALDVTA